MNRTIRSILSLSLAAAFVLSGCKKKETPPDAAQSGSPPAQGAKATPAKAAAPLPKIVRDPIFALAPAKVSVAWIFPHLDSTGRLLRALITKHGPVFGFGGGPAEELLRSLSFGLPNVFDDASRGRWGLDGRRAFAFVVDPVDKAPYAILPVARFDVFEKRLREKLGAGVAYEEAAAAGKKMILGKKGGAVEVAYANVGAFVLLSLGDKFTDAKTAIEGALALGPKDGLAASPQFQATVSKLASVEDILVYFDGNGLFETQLARAGAALPEDEKRSARRLFDQFPGLAVSLSLTEKDVLCEAYLSVGEAAGWKALFPATAAGFPLARFVQSDALATLKGSFEGAALVERLLALDPSLKSRLSQWSAELEPRIGIHMERDLLRNLTGQVAFSIAHLDQGFVKAALDPTQPMEVLRKAHVVLAAQVKNKAGLEKALAQAAQFLKKRPGAKLVMRERDEGDVRVRDLAVNGPTVLSLAVVDDVLVMTTGKWRMAKVIEAARSKVGTLERAPDGEARRAIFADQHAVLSIGFPALQGVLAGLDLGGTGGDELRAYLKDRLVPMLTAFGDATAQVRFDGEGLKLQASLRGK